MKICKWLATLSGGGSGGHYHGGYMKPNIIKRYTGLYIFSACALLFLSSCPLFALGKNGADPGAPAGGGDFVPGNAAVAAEVNKQINLLYKAFNDGTNSINIDGWTNIAANLGYIGGNFGVGVNGPLVKFQVNGGSAITLAGATGFAVFGPTTGNHIAIDTQQIQTKLSATTVAHLSLNPLGGFVGVGTAPGVKFHVDGGSVVSTTSGSGYAAFGPATGQHIAIDTNQIQSKSNGTTAANLAINSLGGYVGIGTTPLTALFVSGAINFGIAIQNPNDTTTFRGASYHFYHQSVENARLTATRLAGNADGADLSFQTRPTAGSLTTRMTILESGEVGINNTAPTFQLHVTGDIKASGCVAASAGTVTGGGTCSSDARLKKNIVNLPWAISLNAFLQLRPVQFEWRDKLPGEKQLGFIAQDIEKIYPQFVETDVKGYKAVNYTGLQWMQTLAVQELIRQNAKNHAAFVSLRDEANRDKAAATARLASLEKRLAEQAQRLNDELMARKQQEIRLAKLEQMLQPTKMARR